MRSYFDASRKSVDLRQDLQSDNRHATDVQPAKRREISRSKRVKSQKRFQHVFAAFSIAVMHIFAESRQALCTFLQIHMPPIGDTPFKCAGSGNESEDVTPLCGGEPRRSGPSATKPRQSPLLTGAWLDRFSRARPRRDRPPACSCRAGSRASRSPATAPSGSRAGARTRSSCGSTSPRRR